MRSDLVDLEATIFHETEKAWLVQTAESHPAKVWIPKVLCEVTDQKPAPSKAATLTLKRSLAEEKGLV